MSHRERSPRLTPDHLALTVFYLYFVHVSSDFQFNMASGTSRVSDDKKQQRDFNTKRYELFSYTLHIGLLSKRDIFEG